MEQEVFDVVRTQGAGRCVTQRDAGTGVRWSSRGVSEITMLGSHIAVTMTLAWHACLHRARK